MVSIMLWCLGNCIRISRLKSWKTKRVLFNQDKTPVHKFVKTVVAMHESGFELIEYPLYALELANVAAFQVFTNVKKDLSGWHYTNDDGIISDVEESF